MDTRNFLDKNSVLKLLQPYAGLILKRNSEIVDVVISPLRSNRSLAVIYYLSIKDSDGNVFNKEIFASVSMFDSGENKKIDYNFERQLFEYIASNPTHTLVVPEPYAYIEEKRLLIRAFINGDSLNNHIKRNKYLSEINARLCASTLLDMEEIKLPEISRNLDTVPNFSDLSNNIEILKNKKHPLYSSTQDDFKRVTSDLNDITSMPEYGRGLVFSHGDFNPLNMVPCAENKMALFDFDSVGLRHYFCDVAGFYSHLNTLAELWIDKEERSKSQKIFLETYLNMKSMELVGNNKKIFDCYKNYFELLARVHMLIWG